MFSSTSEYSSAASSTSVLDAAVDLILPLDTVLPQLSNIKGVLHDSTTEGEASAPAVTPAAVAELGAAAACGKKTKCYDCMTSMNAAYPAVRYGG
jgi:hypothetical protein